MKRKIAVLALCCAGILAGCQSQSQGATGAATENTESSVEAVSAATEESVSDMTMAEGNSETENAEQTSETQEEMSDSEMVESETATEAETNAEAVAAETETTAETEAGTSAETQGEEHSMTIQVQANGNSIVFELNNSQAARELYEQLPLTVENEDFSNNEKTFYPPQKLNVSDAPHTDGSIGTLAYYEPWGDVVLFYGSYNPNGSLYELGKVTEGSEFISGISGEMVITAME